MKLNRFLTDIINKHRQFMYGRYGVDEFSRFLVKASLVAMVVNLITGLRIFYYLFMVMIIKNKLSKQNNKYMIDRAEKIMVKDTIVYIWAVIRKTTEGDL